MSIKQLCHNFCSLAENKFFNKDVPLQICWGWRFGCLDWHVHETERRLKLLRKSIKFGLRNRDSATLFSEASENVFHCFYPKVNSSLVMACFQNYQEKLLFATFHQINSN